ncbi:Vacuolar protein sorting-associated protein 17 [Saitoella coloradoensis]
MDHSEQKRGEPVEGRVQGDEQVQQPQQQQQQPQQIQYFLNTRVTAIERSGRKDPIIRFDAQSNLPRFRTTQFRDIRRTHAEIARFQEYLINANPECIVPPLPPSVTSAGAGTEEDERRVRIGVQNWLDRICANPVLIRDEEMVHFIESDFGYSPSISRHAPATGLRRHAIKQLAPPPDNSPLATSRPTIKQFYLSTLDTASKLEKLSKTRRTLSAAELEFGNRIGGMGGPEHHLGMSNAFRKLGKCVEKIADYHTVQATAESASLGDHLHLAASSALIAKETLTTRQILMRELIHAESTSRKQLATVTRLKASSSINTQKVDEALALLEEQKTFETNLAAKVTRVTSNLEEEVQTWTRATSKELLHAMRDHARRNIEAERRLLAAFETVRPDIRSIDSSGGLSRLGRENLVRARSGSHLQARKGGPDTDPWSALPRASAAVTEREEPVKSGVARVVGGAEERVDARNAASLLSNF